ncbi:S-adenosylmethionine decarboxylase [Candidatus Woesearchaeota archaeon]|nr:S-adenosylmethionine decarboxylase [Candidatus Woesearchaeota archaeon]
METATRKTLIPGVFQGRGTHLTVDAFECDSLRLYEEKRVRKFLEELPRIIGMTPIAEAQIVNYKNPKKELDAGISGFVMIAESHISIHTYPYRGCLFMDVFSCKPFDVEKVKAVLMERFHAGRIEENLIRRGIVFDEKA